MSLVETTFAVVAVELLLNRDVMFPFCPWRERGAGALSERRFRAAFFQTCGLRDVRPISVGRRTHS